MKAFATISRGLRLPSGWGFPPAAASLFSHASEHPDAKRLRGILFPSEETEMLCQLVRWHYALLRSRPHVWRSLAGKYESYEPCGVFKHAIEANTFKLCPDPTNGFLVVGWQHRGETKGLCGTLQRTGTSTASLSFPGWSGSLGMARAEQTEFWKVDWPQWMQTFAAVVIPEESLTENLTISIRVRPLSFDAAGMLQQVTDTSLLALQSVGLLDSFLSAVNPLDKLAVVWLALATLEEEVT